VNQGSGIYAGLMSGTSLDGVDAVVADFGAGPLRVLGQAAAPFPSGLKSTLLRLSAPGPDEIDLAHAAALELAEIYAVATRSAMAAAGVQPAQVRAIGCHGQTIRHRPERGYTVQIGNAARLAERTGIAVVTDFRAADIAAGGQGAPLAPGFHAAFLATPERERVVLNLGGIANITRLAPAQAVTGFDCGPANILLDGWIGRHRQQPFDRDGRWARSGRVVPALLTQMLADPYFAQRPPKSTGRELFNAGWLDRHLATHPGLAPEDVQATLLALTVESITGAVERHCAGSAEMLVCGGGAYNVALLDALAARCSPRSVRSTAASGLPPESIEPLAFAWLARQRIEGRSGNLPGVTGAAGPRILGALYLPPGANG
jgi:anhydro-N-acetylmuramic acid kinase